jgi:hypothetical protein
LTLKDLAQRLGVSESALHSQRHRGVPPGILGVHLGKKIYFRERDLDEHFAAQLAKQQNGAA